MTDYYMFRRLAGTKAKTKFACIGSTKSYEPLEALRAGKKFRSATMDAIEIGDLFVYISKGSEIVKEKSPDRVPDWSMSKTRSITGLFRPDPSKPFGFGDMVDTRDLFLLLFHKWITIGDIFVDGATVEVFVMRGGLNEREAIFSMLCDGLFDDDIAMLRQAVTKEEVFKRWEGSK
ncbi:MAG: hypothetical protein IJ243_03210 [Prevotella sp.]|nr:hypothetical protein [Prevotella sp.]